MKVYAIDSMFLHKLIVIFYLVINKGGNVTTSLIVIYS